MRLFNKGDRVLAEGRPGRVAYRRMLPPNFTEPAAYSVVLDARAADPSYHGTIFAAERVRPIDDPEKVGSDDALGG